MKESNILRLIDLFSPLLVKLGADYPALRKIVQAKLLLDSRRTLVFLGPEGKNNKSQQMIWSFIVFGIIGLFLIPLILIDIGLVQQMSLFFGIVMFILITNMLSDFSAVLLDTRDRGILLSRPVSERTLGLAKLIHIFIYLGFQTVSLAGPGLIAALVTKGLLFFVCMAVSIFSIALMSIVLTALIYSVILKIFEGDTLKNFINYIQIFISGGIFIGLQIITRFVDVRDWPSRFDPEWWHYFIIPIWYGSLLSSFEAGSWSQASSSFTLLAFAVPVVMMILYVKWLPAFERHLVKLEQAGKPKRRGKWDLARFISRLVTRKGEERIFFQWAYWLVKKERLYKRQVYPSLAIATFLPFLLLYNTYEVDDISSFSFLSIYWAGLSIPMLIQSVRFSENHKAAFLFDVLPVDNHLLLKKAANKVVFIRFILPSLLLVGAAFLFWFGVGFLPHLLLVILHCLVFVIICYKVFGKSLPFAEEYETDGARFVLVMVSFMLLGVLVFIHAAFMHFGGWLIWMYIIMVILLNFILWNVSFRRE
ncbi:MAG: hypothetical protein ACI4XL_10705 [Bacillus sp. (in: firmicutes)]